MKKVKYIEEIKIKKELDELNESSSFPHTNPIKANLEKFIKCKFKSIKKDYL